MAAITAGVTSAQAPPGAVYELADSFQTALDLQVTSASDEMLAAWSHSYATTRLEYDLLLQKIAKAGENGEKVSAAWLYQKDRLQQTLKVTKAQVNGFAEHASAATLKAHQAAVSAGAKAAAKMGKVAQQEAGIAGSFTEIDPATMRHAVGFTKDGSPVAALFTGLAADTASAAQRALVHGVTTGKSVDWMRRQLQTALDIPRWRAETIVRTEAQRIFRAAHRQTYIANADLMEGWVWKAKLDSRTCGCCVAMDGTLHPVDATLDGHPRCRCAMLPRTKGWDELGAKLPMGDTRPPIRSGIEWLKAQPAITQRSIMGRRKWEAWLNGDFDLPDLVARTESPTWGTMRRERSLSEIQAGLNANYQDVTQLKISAPQQLAPDRKAVSSIMDTHTLDEVEATLTGMDLTEQGRLNFVAAHKALVGQLQKGPAWRVPTADPEVVAKAVDKMNKAAVTKGFPSKGYSQTVATYKAKANGMPGQKVGVVKSLSWQQKVDAAEALKAHDEWLQSFIQKNSQLKHDGKLTVVELDGDLSKAASHNEALLALNKAKTLTKAKGESPEVDRTLAYVEAKKAAYENEQAAALGFREVNDEWVDGYGQRITISEDGWGVKVSDDPWGGPPATKALKPSEVEAHLKGPDWSPMVPEPDPAAVAQIVEVLTDKDGYLDEHMVKMSEEALAKGLSATPEALVKAMEVAKATLPWKPDPKAVPGGPATMKAAVKTPKAPAAPKVKAPSAPPVQASGTVPDVTKLKDTGKVLGTHGAKVYTDELGQRWLFKPPKDAKDAFLASLDESASRLQSLTGLKAPDTHVVTLGGKRGSIQRMFDATDAFPSGLKPDTLDAADLLAVQKEQVLDWLLSNHDGHHQQFLRLPDGTLTGIDKGQAFRWFGQDKLDWEFHPNSSYGAPEPVYNTLWRSFAKGGKVEALDPSTGPLADFIKSVQGISDNELRDLFRDYAEQASARGLLAKRQTFPGLKAPSVPANDVEAFLDALVARKNGLDKDFATLYQRAVDERLKALPTWTPPKVKTPRGSAAKRKWLGKDKPAKPEPPSPPDDTHTQALFPGWTQKVKDKYSAFTGGKSLEASNNWARMRRVIENRDKGALQELLDRHYVDQDLYDEALALIKRADDDLSAGQAAYAKALAAHERALKRWNKDTKDWREANGVTGDSFVGMDAKALRPKTDAEGVRWANGAYKNPGYTTPEIKALKSYTGSGYTSINSTLRALRDGADADPKNWGSQRTAIKNLDAAMARSSLPEDVLLARGTGVDSFTINGKLLGYGDENLLPQIVGTVQRDNGYGSTSVGLTPHFSSKPVIVRIWAPKGTPAVYVDHPQDRISSIRGEREMVLGRGQNLYIHAVYKQGGKTVVEAEIVPDDWEPPLGPDGKPEVSPAGTKWGWP